MLSVDVINADSNYIIIKQLCNELLKTDKYNFFLMLDKDRKYVKDDLNKSVKIFQVPFPRSKKHQVIHFNTNILRKIFKDFAIDLVWNNVVEQGHHFKYFQDSMIEEVKFKVFNYHHYVIHRSLDKITMYNPCKHIMYDQIVGSSLVDLNYFHTKHCFNMLIEEASDILLPNKVQEIKDKSIVDIGGYCNEIISTNKYEDFTFIYNHRLAGYKNWKITFEMFDRLWSEGIRFKVIVSGGDKSRLSAIEAKPYVEIKSFSVHSEYLKELSRCHANTLNSHHETFCISVAESIMNNQVIIAPNRVTFPELVDKDYPYLFETEEEQYEILKKLITENIREYKYKESDKLLLTEQSKKIDKMFQNMVKKGTKTDIFASIKKESTKIAIKKYLSTHNEIKLVDFKNFIFRMGYASQSFPHSKIKKIFNEFGFVYNIHIDKYIK